MNRRRRQRRQRNGRNGDVDQPVDQSNGSHLIATDCQQNGSPAENEVTNSFTKNLASSPVSSPSDPTPSNVSVSSPSFSDDDNVTTSTNVPDTQFAAFSFWKPQLPTIDDEITALLDGKQHFTSKAFSSCGRTDQGRYYANSPDKDCDASSRQDFNGSEYNQFNFWKAPIADIDDDLCQTLGLVL